MYKISGFRRILFLILAAVFLVSLSAVMYWRYLDTAILQKESDRLFANAQNLAKKFDYNIDAQLQVLASVGESLEGLPRVEDLRGLMLYLARQQTRGSFGTVGFQFQDGRAYLSDGSARDNFLSAQEVSAAYDNKYYVSAPQGGKQITAAVPVYRNGAGAGVLFASQPDVFYEQLLSGETPWFITAPAGEIILKYTKDTPDAEACLKNNMAQCGDYLISRVALGYNGWQLLAFKPAAAPWLQKQLMTAVFMFVAIIIVLGLLLVFIIHTHRQHSSALYSAGFIYHVTGLGNHNYFQSNFNKAAAAFRKDAVPFTLTIININRFKAINDIYGFEQGDNILRHVAQILKEEIKEKELLGHSSSDRFFLLLACPDRAEFGRRIEKILSRVKHFCQGDKLCFDIAVSAGVYLADEDIPFYIMIDRSNMALKSIRHDAGQTFAFYNEEYREQIKNITDIESKMDTALAKNQFKIFIQPKYNFKTGRIESAEALVRWQEPKKGLIPPDKFIPVFEHNGFVLKLDMFILEETVKLLARRIKEGKRVVPAGVNFSRLHLEDARFIDSVTKIVDRHGLAHNLIELEITESIAFDKTETMRNVLDGLHARGFSVAMDDFGAGYSSLNILKDLHFDTVKLDKEFLARAESGQRMRQIISGTVEMIKKLGCLIVTEGVETKEQADFLRDIGCDLAQGYLYSRPLPPQDFEKLLDEDAPKII